MVGTAAPYCNYAIDDDDPCHHYGKVSAVTSTTTPDPVATTRCARPTLESLWPRSVYERLAPEGDKPYDLCFLAEERNNPRCLLGGGR
jgi:hypothetical protein